MTVQEAYTRLMYQLFELYDDREAENIADMIIEHITGFRKIDRIINKQFPLSEAQIQLLNGYTIELLQHKPVQYVLHEAWFAGMKLYVDENVLIPRPETEELVRWIIADCRLPIADSKTNSQSPIPNSTLLDIGTGSGCISVALKKKLSGVEIHALDISGEALNVANRNAATQQTKMIFYHLNILDRDQWQSLPIFNVIVSNPPYVKQSESSTMQKNILKYEPHIALFVPNDDALLFFKAIAEFGLQHLNANGKLFFEINETLGKEVTALLEQYGYNNIELKKDFQGKDRMVKAEAPNP